MTKIEAFKCEKCHKLYEKEAQAEACESKHSDTAKIVDMKFSPEKEIPEIIVLEFPSGRRWEFYS